jgi:hypothetical protein
LQSRFDAGAQAQILLYARRIDSAVVEDVVDVYGSNEVRAREVRKNLFQKLRGAQSLRYSRARLSSRRIALCAVLVRD